MSDVTVPEPFPISFVAGAYLVFDPNTITYVRRKHHICGVPIGTLPHYSMQNVFLGVPLELMAEEARLLVEKGHAYIVNDAEAHRSGILNMGVDERRAFTRVMELQGLELAKMHHLKKAGEKEELMKTLAEKKTSTRAKKATPEAADTNEVSNVGIDCNQELLFGVSEPSSPLTTISSKLVPYGITPTTSYPPLPAIPSNLELPPSLPAVPRSYPLFAHLHGKGYFMTPGIKFGCQYSIYPGDPLRYHSHFLGVGLDWEEEFDLMDVIGGGRLGTGVKKAYLLGGVGKTLEDEDAQAGGRYSL